MTTSTTSTISTTSPEFDLIARHFTRPARRGVLGIGDDCALLDVTPGKQLAVSTDTLVSGVHFFADTDAHMLGHKALAVNLSDLAAMGASPRYCTLAITLPQIDDVWLGDFARGFFGLADQYDVVLIGGDTTRGPLSMTLTVLGQVAPGRALQRDHAHTGDDIWVSAALGGAAMALRHLRDGMVLPKQHVQTALMRLHMPQPRIALGLRLSGLAGAEIAAIDVSDGLIADLGHICARSGLGADVDWKKIPLHPALLAEDEKTRMACALAGGDDYELCFTAPPSRRAAIAAMADDMALPLTLIGAMKAGNVVVVRDAQGEAIKVPTAGFDHFARASAKK